MKKMFVLCMTVMLIILSVSMVRAETIMIYGTVINTNPHSIVRTPGEVIEQINVAVGDQVSAGDVIATRMINRVYAPEDGTAYIFGTPGERVDDITAQYGAVAYIAPANPYTITAAAQNRNGNAVSVIPNEAVYLRSYKDGKNTGMGILAKVENGKYTVIVTEGKFTNGETVSIYRDPAYTDVSRIGRAKVTAADMTICKGEGSLLNFHVQNGMAVKKGILLYETISGTFTPGSTCHDKVLSPVNGIIAAVYEQSELGIGTSAADNNESNESSPFSADSQVLAVIYPDSDLRVIAYAPENVLNDINVGDSVRVICQYIENMSEPITGTVEKISRIPVSECSGIEEQYGVYVKVEDINSLYYGMSIIVETENDG